MASKTNRKRNTQKSGTSGYNKHLFFGFCFNFLQLFAVHFCKIFEKTEKDRHIIMTRNKNDSYGKVGLCKYRYIKPVVSFATQADMHVAIHGQMLGSGLRSARPSRDRKSRCIEMCGDMCVCVVGLKGFWASFEETADDLAITSSLFFNNTHGMDGLDFEVCNQLKKKLLGDKIGNCWIFFSQS